MDATCQCGTITFTTPLPQPLKVIICHCTQCRSQSSSTYGITLKFPYFPLPDSPHLKSWSRITWEGREKRCYFCGVCGVRLAHWLVEEDTITVKGCVGRGLTRRMLEGAVHIWGGKSIVDIPVAAEQWMEEEGAVMEAGAEGGKAE